MLVRRWVCSGLLAAMVSASVFNFRWSAVIDTPRGYVFAKSGAVGVWDLASADTTWGVRVLPRGQPWHWLPAAGPTRGWLARGAYEVVLPLWIPELLLAGVLAASYRRQSRLDRRHARCPICEYARDGLPSGNPCPECGNPSRA